MKKTAILSIILAISTTTVLASDFGNALKKSIKQDARNTRIQYEQAIQQDIENQRQANMSVTNAKKAEKIKQIDRKLADLNREKETVNKAQGMSATEKLMRTRSIQRQINFYTEQKKALN